MMIRNRVIVALITALALSVPLAAAQSDPPEKPDAPAGAEANAADQSKQAAKDKRIEEYLRKREERRARKELKQQNRGSGETEAGAVAIESEMLAAEAAAVDSAPVPAATTTGKPGEVVPAPLATTESKKGKKANRSAKSRRASSLPKDLARAQHNVRISELATDPTVQEYLVMIDEQRASPHQLAAFGSFLAQNGMLDEAIAYYDIALRVEPGDPLLWINNGTLQLKAANLSAAASSFSRALEINPNSAVAHYNMGSTLKEMNRYEEAILEYKIALRIDPTLGDPAKNPSSASNKLLTAVKLLLYQEQAGSLSVPLVDVETGRLLTETSQTQNP